MTTPTLEIAQALRNFREIIHPSPPLDMTAVIDQAREAYSVTQLRTERAKADDLDWFRVSSLAGMCVRWEVFRRIIPELNNVPSAHWETDMLLRFRMGRLVEEVWRSDCLGRSGLLIGKWRCSVCHERRTGRLPVEPCKGHVVVYDEIEEMRKKSCESMKTKWIYDEQTVAHDHWRVRGSFDARLEMPKILLTCEVKSDRPSESSGDPGGWENRTAADPDHLYQLNHYMWMNGDRHGLVSYHHVGDLRKVKIYYHQFVQHPITETQTKIATVNRLVEARNPFGAPRCSGCAKSTNMRAVRCPARSLCFERTI